MNKSAIQKFAIWARTTLMEQVAQRAYQYGITKDGYGEENAVTVNGMALSPQEQSQRRELVREIQAKGYDQVVEEVAYTWFNRFIALRYMEVNNYLPSHIRVFSNAQGAFDPEILKEALHIDLPGLDQSKVAEYIEKTDNEALYRYLLLTQCNALNEGLPKMFEKMGGYTELLFPNNILRPDSVLGRMVADIPEEDWTDQVQIIGWLYQYYNTDLKAETFDLLKKNVKVTKERIPSATQLFTPDWIVRYMVENSLGRLWLEGHPNQALRESWKYYLDEAKQEPEVEAQLVVLRAQRQTLRPEDITLIDPCMGSGHILVYAFDVLMQIYESVGWSQRDAAVAIVQKNLYGLDIDRRAAQLAYFAVMMKARQYDRRFLTRGVQPNVFSVRSSQKICGPYRYEMGNFLLSKEHQETLNYILEHFLDIEEYGSLLKLENRDYQGLLEAWQYTASQTTGNLNLSLWYSAVEQEIPQLIRQAIMLARQYDVVVTNPPYMGSSNMNDKLSKFVKENYPNTKSDLSTAFMERSISLCNPTGYMSMINIPVWMFLSSYETLREHLIAQNTFINMIHFGRGVFGSDFGTTSFVVLKAHIGSYASTYRRLFEKQGAVDSVETKEEWFLAGRGAFSSKQCNFFKIPGSPIAYWASKNMLMVFEHGLLLGSIADSKQGIATADNSHYLRLWHEVENMNMKLDAKTHDESALASEKWYPYNKGGEFRKWYGNNEYVVNWKEDGAELKSDKKAVLRNPSYYFKPCFSWSLVSSSVAAFRYKPAGHIFDVAGMSCFSNKYLKYLLALCNTKVVMKILEIIAPTINYQCGDIANIPVLLDDTQKEHIEDATEENIKLSKQDWDSYETSWDFKRHPLV